MADTITQDSMVKHLGDFCHVQTSSHTMNHMHRPQQTKITPQQETHLKQFKNKTWIPWS